MNTGNRPLSPHLQVYRWQWTMALSIIHRATGVALAVGALMMVCWLVAVAQGGDAYAAVNGFLSSWVGRLMLFGWTWSLLYHLANGIRHLAWDAGSGLELDAARTSGYGAAVFSVVGTIALWAAAYSMTGAFS